MQKFLAPFPLVRLLIPLVGGIVIAGFTDLSSALLITAGAISLLAMAATHFLLKQSSKYYSVNGAVIFIFMLVCGLMLREYREYAFAESEASVAKEEPVMLRIANDPEPRDNNVRCIAEITAVLEDSVWHATDAKTMLYVKRNAQSEQLKYGDELLVMGGVLSPIPPMNPGEFDYAGWLNKKGIAFVCFAREEWEVKGHSEPSWLKARALQIRNYFRERMVEAGLSGQELAVSEALLLGQSSEIDPQLLASYSASGTLHVLSVSGMHVALVFVVLLKLLAPLEKKKKGKWLSFAIQFLVIWFYAFMTGMSPSVLRSVTMLSVIIAGKIINRKSHLLNTLAASAIILLIADPMLCEDAGFLLSYCAVAGIVIVQPMIEQWWKPQSKIVQPLWSLISVTIAAQIFTFPLGLYFFQQFPTWFILTNLVIIPLSTICLYAGLIFLAISWWKWLAALFAVVFGFLISLLNGAVSYTEFLPAAVVHTSGWNIFELILLYVLIAAILLLFRVRAKRMVFAAIACFLVLIVSVAAGRHLDLSVNEISVFHINKGMVIGLTENGKVTLLSDSITLSDPDQLNFHVNPRYKKIGIDDLSLVNLQTTDSLQAESSVYRSNCLFKGERKFWCGYDTIVPTVVFDAFIIHGKNFWLLEEMQDVETHEIIITGEVKKKWTDKWKEEATRRKIPVYVTSERGARIFDF